MEKFFGFGNFKRGLQKKKYFETLSINFILLTMNEIIRWKKKLRKKWVLIFEEIFWFERIAKEKVLWNFEH